MSFRRIDVSTFGDVPIATQFGDKPVLRWIKISDLVIDESYQRECLRAGRKNVLQIAANFDWPKFGALLVAQVSEGPAIIDGQHRTMAAALCKIVEVPCLVIEADQKAQAEAFAAINSVRTAMTALQLHAASVRAGEPRAVALDAICRQAGVRVLRFPYQAKDLKIGDTMAVGALGSGVKKFGRFTVLAALQTIVKAGEKGRSWLRAPIITALCATLDDAPDWRGPDLQRAMATFDFGKQFARAGIDNRKFGRPVVVCMAALIRKHLEAAYGEEAA